MKYVYFFLAGFLCSISIYANEIVSFNNIWSVPYKVSEKYPHQLENTQGKFLFVLNKTAWAYFACEYPEKVIESTIQHGANVIRVCLEGQPYFKVLNYNLWPWGGTRTNPDFSSFNEKYWAEVERRIRYAGEKGIGIDLVLYFSLKPSVSNVENHKKYWEKVIKQLSKYSNILSFEIMNEEISNEAFQDSAGMFFKNNDPNGHLIISSDGTTDDALWPHKPWMDLALVHTCTGNQPQYGLKNWYLNIAHNVKQYGKPAFNNETGREKRHKNDDPIYRRKQSWLFANSGVSWTWHSWDGCEGINDTVYKADGWQFLAPLRKYYESISFWELELNETVFSMENSEFVYTTLASPDRKLNVAYCCTQKTSEMVENAKALLRLKDGEYKIKFINPANLEKIGEQSIKSGGLRNVYSLSLPKFQDDLLIEIENTKEKEKSLIEGTL